MLLTLLSDKFPSAYKKWIRAVVLYSFMVCNWFLVILIKKVHHPFDLSGKRSDFCWHSSGSAVKITSKRVDDQKIEKSEGYVIGLHNILHILSYTEMTHKIHLTTEDSTSHE